MTHSTNEADRDDNHQPRSSSLTAPSRSVWALIIPIAALVIMSLTILTPRDMRRAPPELELRSPKNAAAQVPPAPPKEPIVRVNVTPGGVDSFRLEIRGRYRWKSLTSNESLVAGSDLGIVDVKPGKTGLLLGSESIASDRIEIVPDRTPAIKVNGQLYRGSMRLLRRSDGKVSAVNVLSVEEYLGSVVDSEMPAKFPDAARQAQAIVARTYALYQIEQANPKSQYDLLSSQRSQKYLGVEYLDAAGRRLAGESDSSRRAVQATRGLVCQRRDKLFCTYYSAVCGGQTIDGGQVFKDASDVLRTVPCEWCRDSPYYRWTKEVSRSDFQTRVSTTGADLNQPITIRQLNEPGAGSIAQFELDNGRERKKLSGIELRERLPTGLLLSPHFNIRADSDRIVFEGRGHGHGVGFCQWGAKGQAEAGHDCREIVLYYFPGAELKTLDY